MGKIMLNDVSYGGGGGNEESMKEYMNTRLSYLIHCFKNNVIPSTIVDESGKILTDDNGISLYIEQ